MITHEKFLFSFTNNPAIADVEGLHPSLYRTLDYPGYDGGRTMNDIPSAFLRYSKP